jgi:polyferredoxin
MNRVEQRANEESLQIPVTVLATDVVQLPVSQPKTNNKLGHLLQRLGDIMQAKRNFIQGIQWFVVVFYFTLLIWPAFLALPKDYVHFYDNLVLLAQFIFWGIWWPFVMLSMVLIGRVWCGVFCPEGALSEWSSRHGLGRSAPRWIRWGGWPFVAFVTTTIYGQLISVYEYPKAALLILGGSTIAAMLVGFIYGRGKRVWCRHLCPANGVFSLLSRLAPVHFNVERNTWKQAPRLNYAIDCPPMLNVHNKVSNSGCHMCGRCSGYREAVTLSLRSPNNEVLAIKKDDANPWDIALLFFGLLGIATGAFQWSASPWFVQLKQTLAEWFIDRELFGMLDTSAPWWLLTHYPDTNDVFSYLDGFSILLYIFATASVITASLFLGLLVAGRLLNHEKTNKVTDSQGIFPWLLGYAFIPLAGVSLFLGLSSLTIAMLKAEHLSLTLIAPLRISLLVLAYTWSGYLLAQKLRHYQVMFWRKITAFLLIILSSSLVGFSWLTMFFIW